MCLSQIYRHKSYKFLFCLFNNNNFSVIKTRLVFRVVSFTLLLFHLLLNKRKKARGLSLSLQMLHHPVSFYFTVLSEPSQDSSPGQFLFYRPVGTVTGLITDEGGISSSYSIIYPRETFYNTFFKYILSHHDLLHHKNPIEKVYKNFSLFCAISHVKIDRKMASCMLYLL